MAVTEAISTRAEESTALVRPSYDPAAGIITIPTPVDGVNLTFTPQQRTLSEQQLVLLAPLGFQAGWDPRYVAAFLMECRTRGFDPWHREAYLMLYPGGKYIHHIGIAGMRKHADATGQWRGCSQLRFHDDTGKVHTVWPYKDAVPYAAEIDVYRQGWEPRTMVALYDEYCPLEEEKRSQQQQDGSYKRVATGGGKVPTPMWQPAAKGGKPTVMLGKVAEAAGLRATFPNKFGGWYVQEELERLAADIPSPQQESTTAARREAYRVANGAGPVTDGADIGVEVLDQQPPADPDDDGMTAERARELLLAELDAQAAILGRDRAWMVKRWSAARGGQVFEAADLADVAAHVRRFRDYTVSVLRERGAGEMADRYAAAPFAATVADLFGVEDPAGVLAGVSTDADRAERVTVNA